MIRLLFFRGPVSCMISHLRHCDSKYTMGNAYQDNDVNTSNSMKRKIVTD